MKEEYLSVIRSVKANVDELIAPLDTAQLEYFGENGERIQNSLDLIVGELIMVVLLFSSVDGVVLDGELDLINDVRKVVHGQGTTQFTTHDYEDLCRKVLDIYSVRRVSVDLLPISLQVLLEYDKKHGTNHEEKVRDLFVNFAEAIVVADNNEHPVETVILENFKDVLNKTVH